MCRPTKYTRRTANTIIEAILSGKNREASAIEAGIHVCTLYEWMNEYPEFAEKVHEADFSVKGEVEKCAYDGAKEDPFVALKYLAAKHPEEWAPNRKQDVNFTMSDKRMDLSKLTDEELAVFEALAAKVKPDGD